MTDNKLRKKAGEKLHNLPKLNGYTPEETSRLIHELEVHQFELKMQNQELKKAQQEIERSRKKYADLYNFAPVAYFTFDRNGTILEANLTGAKLLARERGRIINSPFTLYVKPEDKYNFHSLTLEVIEKGINQICEIKILRKDRTWFYGRLEAAPVGNNQIRAALFDIDELKSTQQELKLINEELEQRVERRTHELKESELRYKQLLESITDYIYNITIENGEPIRTSYSPSCQAVTGYTAEDYENDPSLWHNIVPPVDRHALIEQVSRVMTGENVPPVEHRIIHKDGSIRWVKNTQVARFDENGCLRAIYGLIGDITDRKRFEEMEKEYLHNLEKEVADQTAELKHTYWQLLHTEKLTAMGRFSASIAHEFNNPTFAIRSVLGGIKKRASMDAEDMELVDMAIEECDRIKGLILDLQHFHRPSSGIKSDVDINDTIDNMLLFLRKEFENKKISVEKNYAPALPRIKAVADQIKQVILNLLTNAMDAMSEGKEGRIQIITESHNWEEVTIHVRDSGPGISTEDKAHIFEPFFSTKPEVSGTGLGLSISYGIIKRHGGEIRVSSEPDQGATFTVILPVSGIEEDIQANS